MFFSIWFTKITDTTASTILQTQIIIKTNASIPLKNEGLTNEVFNWEDYSVLCAMLIISCAIGLFYGYFGEKQTTGDDFLLGGSSMGTFPTALSLAAR